MIIEVGEEHKANVLVGDVTFVNSYHNQFGTSHLRTIVLLDGLEEDLLSDVNHEAVYQGLRSKSACPVLTLSSPDYEGKSIAGKPLLQSGRKVETMGRPLPGVALKIVNDNGSEVSVGGRGNVLAKGADYDPNETDSSSKKYIVGSDIVKANGGEVVAIPLVDGFSTTRILEKLKK